MKLGSHLDHLKNGELAKVAEDRARRSLRFIQLLLKRIPEQQQNQGQNPGPHELSCAPVLETINRVCFLSKSCIHF